MDAQFDCFAQYFACAEGQKFIGVLLGSRPSRCGIALRSGLDPMRLRLAVPCAGADDS